MNFEIPEALRTAIELPCDHLVCARCYVSKSGATILDENKLECLVCGEKYKLRGANQRLIIEAKNCLAAESMFTCHTHKDEPIR